MALATLIAAGAVIAQADSGFATPKVVSVSMFKNGYAFVTREIKVTDGKSRVVEVPQTSLGSLWFWPNEGQIDSVTSEDEKTPETVVIPFESYDEILRANIGRTFTFSFVRQEKKEDKTTEVRTNVTGILRGYKGDMILFESTDGTTTATSRKQLETLSSSDKNVVYSQTVKGQKSTRFYEIKTKGGAKTVMMMSLERGMAWAPGYAIDLSNPEKLTFTAKSTVLNDLLDLDNARVRLITGFPNLQFSNILDPLTSRMSLDDWLRSLNPGMAMQSGGLGGGGGAFANRAVEARPSAAPGGGPGNPFFGQGDVIADGDNATGEQLEDLFFYDIEGVSLKKGSRSYQYLYKFEVPYKRVYTWDGEQGTPVQNKIKFKNTNGKPISTAAASMFNKGEIVGQGMMNYTGANMEAELVVSRSLDFVTSSTTDVVERQTGAIKDKKGNPITDLVTYETELEVQNPKSDPVNFQVKKMVFGEVLKSEPKPANDTNRTGVRGSNPTNVLTWDMKLEPGTTQKIVIRYKTYVPTGQ